MYIHMRIPIHTHSKQAPQTWWNTLNIKTSFMDEHRLSTIKPVFTPRNASVSKDAYKRAQPPALKKAAPSQVE